MKKNNVTQFDLEYFLSLAHSLNNQLTGIRGAAEILIEKGHSEDTHLAAQILECSTRAARLVGELQDRAYELESNENGSESNSSTSDISDEVNGLTVLVVDDEIAILNVCQQILRSAGFRVISASSGSEAIALFEKQSANISAVLLDVELPYMHGSLVYAKLKAITPDVPVIAMSGSPKEHIQRYFEEAGLAGFQKKPFQPSELIELVQESLKLRNTQKLVNFA